LLIAAVIILGCARAPRNDSTSKQQEPTGVPVQTVSTQLGTMVEEVPVTGTISALRKADITAQISGRVLEVKVRDGDSVRAGDVVVSLDKAELASQVNQARAGVVAAQARLEAARKRYEVVRLGARSEERAMAASRLEQAEAALRQAAADQDRMRKLFQQGAVSKQQVEAADTAYDTARTNRDSARDSLKLTEIGPRPEEIEAARQDVQAAQAGLDQAQSALAQVQELLGYTTIRSPVTGVVYERNVEPGEIASSGGGGKPLLRVADLSSLYLEATVPERLAHQVHADQRVKVSLQSLGGRSLEGRVQRLVPVADPTSRDFLVRVTIADPQVALRPGVFAQARILVRERRGVVVVPKEALVSRGGRLEVFLVQQGKAVERPVEVGVTDRTQAEILSGVKPGDSVVVVGAQALKNGDLVRVGRGSPGGQ
jgi:multidrug efflux pump subunit AcrA (membrane-fusion protein)